MTHFAPTIIEPSTALPFDGYAHSRVPRLLRAADGSIDVRGTLDLLLVATPGPDVQSVASQLGALSPGELTEADRVDLVVIWERCDAWLQAQKQTPLAQLGRAAGRKSTTPGRYEDLGLELSLACRWSERMAQSRMHAARIFDERLPGTTALLAAGEISYSQALLIKAGADKLDHADADDPVRAAAELERRVLPKAPAQRWAETDKAVTRAVMAIDPASAEDRRKRTRAERGVFRAGGQQTLEDRLDQRSSFFTRGPAEDGELMWTALNHGADQLVATGQADTLAQGRHDTLRSWAAEHMAKQPMPARGARPTSLTVIAKETTLSGEDDDAAELVGYGPITAVTARDLAFGVPPAPGPFSAPDSAVDIDTLRWARHVQRKQYDPLDWIGDEPDPPDDSDPDTDTDTDTDDDPPPYDDGGDGPGGSGGGGGGPPPATPASPSPVVRTRTLRIDPDTGFALPRDGLRLDYGTSRRVWPAEVIDHLRDKYRVCSFPGCNARAETLDGDHWTPRSNGGATDAGTNAGPGCVHHNRTTRNRPGWQITPNGDGTATLRTPHGRSYPIEPFDYRDL